MKKLLCLITAFCLLAVLSGCGATYDLAVENHAWTFDNLIASDVMSVGGFCNPDLADQYPDLMPMQMVLNPSAANPLQFELVVGDEDINRYAWAFELVEAGEKSNVYAVTDTGDGDGNDTPVTYYAAVSTVDLGDMHFYTLVVEAPVGIYTFTAPMDN